MSTPIEPRDDEPIEETLRPHLWRLRARLVTPPEEARVAADLDRLHRAAREHAHGAPTGGEVVAIPGAGGGDQGPGWSRFGQVAAALLLVVAVGGGLAVGSNSTSSDPLVADGAPQPDGTLAESGDPARGDTSTPGGADSAEHSDASDADVEVERAPQDGVDSPDAAGAVSGDDGASGTDAASGGDGTADSGAGGPGAPTSPAGPAQGGSGSASGGSESDPAPAAPGESGPPPANDDSGSEDSGSQDPPAEPPSGEEIIAAPDPGELDGFGGQRPCPDGSISDDCLAPDQGAGDADDSDVGSGDGQSDDSSGGAVARPEPEQPESPSQPTTPTE